MAKKYIAVVIPYHPVASTLASVSEDKMEEKDASTTSDLIEKREKTDEVGPLIDQPEIIPVDFRIKEDVEETRLDVEPTGGKTGYRYRKGGKYNNSHKYF